MNAAPSNVPSVNALVRPCPSCGAKNRITPQHLADVARCGRCKTELGSVDYPLDVNADDFAAITRGTSLPVLVDFWAAWCGPCRMAAPVVKTVAKDLAGKVVVLKVDTEKDPGLASQYGVQGIPNFIVLRNGQLVSQRAGFMPAPEMKRWLASAGAGQ